jgi:hypothetical protein
LNKKKIEGIVESFENTTTGRAASTKGDLNAARIMTLLGEEGGGGGGVGKCRPKIHTKTTKATFGNNITVIRSRFKHKKRKFKIFKINREKCMQRGVHTTRGSLYTMQLYSRKTAWRAQVWERAKKSDNIFYVLQKSVKGKLRRKAVVPELYIVKTVFTQTKNERKTLQ